MFFVLHSLGWSRDAVFFGELFFGFIDFIVIIFLDKVFEALFSALAILVKNSDKIRQNTAFQNNVEANKVTSSNVKKDNK